ncbi:unnamed protein product [Zymoseptoria tritici ST99CH_3D7]|uniref:Uncharacterized protein n=1 Tax=Zymoseptoria tritici (strain ST99CH_3D7) TaxID=1276538 RepID=A0A1X7S1S0_ZYMT9|nr:unnamed protein product [Zymoseptoria tritici ST99CH_3D7]
MVIFMEKILYLTMGLHRGTTTRVYAVPPCPLRLDLAARGAHVDICPRVNGQARGARLTTNSQFLTRWTHAFRHISDEGNRIRSWRTMDRSGQRPSAQLLQLSKPAHCH